MNNYSLDYIESSKEIQISFQNVSKDYDASRHYEDKEPKCYHSSTLELVSPETQHILVFLYSVTAVLSLLGNLTVIAVQMMGNEPAVSVRRHLISLAIADIISGVLCVPFSFTIVTLRQW